MRLGMLRPDPPSDEDEIDSFRGLLEMNSSAEEKIDSSGRDIQEAVLRAMLINRGGASAVTPGRMPPLHSQQSNSPTAQSIQDRNLVNRALGQPNYISGATGQSGFSSPNSQLQFLRTRLAVNTTRPLQSAGSAGGAAMMPSSPPTNPVANGGFSLPAAATAVAPVSRVAASVSNKRQRRPKGRAGAASGSGRSGSSKKPAAFPGKERQAWDDRFAQLQAYKRKHGNANPPQTRGAPPEDYKLGCWLNGQRQKFRKSSLDVERCRKLLRLGCEGFGEEQRGVDVEEERPAKRKKVSWETRYLELVEYKRKFGHANPLYGKATPESCQYLAQWLSNQRSDYRAGKKISADQIQCLRDLGCKGFEEEHEV